MKLLLFDLDGTLLLTGGAGVGSMHVVGARMFGDHFTLDGVTVAGGLDPLIYADAATLAGVDDAHLHHDIFRDSYVAELEQALNSDRFEVHVLPGVMELLNELRQSPQVTLGLLTGNYAVSAPVKLRAVGIDPDWFTITAFGDEAPDRPAMVKLAMERFARKNGANDTSPSDVIVIGDTPRDVDCAKANGCRVLAVATGRYGMDELREAGADVVVPDLKDSTALWQMIRS
jgi:phosphoglycolate phosphatase-like HAD superfamily hydrolase